MLEVRIRKFETHYRLPPSVLRERRRLEQVRATVLEEALELALERAGVPEDGELCIRQIYAPIHLRVTNTEAEMAMQWSLALAAEIERALRDGHSANVVFYPAGRQALMELTMNAARGDFRRAWAWRQLGLWHAGEQPDETEAIFGIVNALKLEATMVLPALQALLEAGLLIRVAQRVTDEQWEILAQAALSAMAAVPLLDESAPTPRAVRDAMRVLHSSRLLRALMASQMFTSETAARAIAVLAVLDAEPALLRTNTAQALIQLVANAIRTTRAETIYELQEARSAEIADERLGNAEAKTSPLDLRQRALTRFGGLLYLLGVIEDAHLPDEMLAQFATRSLRWTLHQIAMTLVAINADDPAALAFAGLRPEATPPDAQQEPCSKNEARALQMFATRILARLRALLNWQTSDAALLAFVCQRPAEIIADPGWIEVRFSLDSVTTEIRRAGLDLDPGYVSWLGVVVKFVYA